MADTAQARNGTVNGETESTSPVFKQDSSSSQAFDRPDPEDTAVDCAAPAAAEGQGTIENTRSPTPTPKDTPVPEEVVENKPVVKEEEELLDYEHYEALDQKALAKNTETQSQNLNGADRITPPVTEGDREPFKGTPTSEPNSDKPADSAQEEHTHKTDLKPEKPNEEENETEPNEQSQGPEPADTQETREADETSEDGTGERPVRQQLKKTSIVEAAHTESPADPDRDHPMATESSQPSSSGKDSQPSSAEGRGRVRKRSLDDVDRDEETLSKEEDDSHKRKRSRDSKDDSKSADIQGVPGDTANATVSETAREETTTTPPPEKTDELEKLRSPKKKRSREQLEDDASKSTDKPELTQESSAEGEREAKRPRDNSQERNKEAKKDEDAKSSLPNPFSNTYSASPFASVAKPSEEPSKEETKKEQPMTSSSAFASSSLAAFAGSDKSPFGSIGTGGSVFKSASTTPAPVGETKDSGAAPSAFAKSAFGAAAAAPSAFSSIGGGFGGSAFGSAFGGSALKPAGGLTSFASPSTPAVLGSSSKIKAFGSTSDDEKEDEENQGGEEGGKEFQGLEDEKPDERFTKQDTETGEENEETFYTCRAKLFQFDGKEWKERGVGNLKVNVTLPSDETAKPEDGGESGKALGKKTARLIMRSDGVHRVILNTPLYKEIKFGTPTGEIPTGKLVNVAGVENGKIVPFLIRTPSPEVAKDLYYSVQELLPQL